MDEDTAVELGQLRREMRVLSLETRAGFAEGRTARRRSRTNLRSETTTARSFLTVTFGLTGTAPW